MQVKHLNNKQNLNTKPITYFSNQKENYSNNLSNIKDGKMLLKEN